MQSRRLSALLASVAVGALATVAGVAASSATELCSELAKTCEEKAVFASGTTLKAELKSGTVATFATTSGNVKCSQGTIEGKTGASVATPLPLTISAMSFSGCTLNGEKCTLTSLHLSYGASLFAGKSGNGTLYLDEATETEAEENPPGQKVACVGSAECTYSASELPFDLVAGNPSTLTIAGSNLWGKGKGCEEATISAEYRLTAPNAGSVGAAQASSETALCQLNETKCAAPYAKGKVLKGVKTQAVTVALLPTATVITCVTSILKAKLETARANPLPAELTSLEFIDCTTGAHTCNVKAIETPYLETSMLAGGGGNGKWVAALRLEIDCVGAGISGCKYEKMVSMALTGGAPAKIALSAPVDGKAQFKIPPECGAKAYVSASYSLTEPVTAVFMTK